MRKIMTQIAALEIGWQYPALRDLIASKTQPSKTITTRMAVSVFFGSKSEFGLSFQLGSVSAFAAGAKTALARSFCASSFVLYRCVTPASVFCRAVAAARPWR